MNCSASRNEKKESQGGHGDPFVTSGMGVWDNLYGGTGTGG